MDKAILTYKYGNDVKSVMILIDIDYGKVEFPKADTLVFRTVNNKGLVIKWEDFVSLEEK